MAVDKHEQIRRRAYEIWENEGRPEGAAFRHWMQAFDEIEGNNEHETMQDLIDEDDYDDIARTRNSSLQDATHEGRRAERKQDAPKDSSPPHVEITTGEEPVQQKVKGIEGP
ncbi:DUF2934 domain-containing protein [Rhizobium sp. BK251]|uniref:DUF2934 domain-containing protein n=1 Tax=Rhizobium sp. BK251 TaxID=2512125 RepID=UPI00104C52F4|nr:DUF2934 domain-containing protein [Rhizobium sp. BK251]TCL66319.1 DUF2934 family protein [Rhizobium sp. BK251]